MDDYCKFIPINKSWGGRGFVELRPFLPLKYPAKFPLRVIENLREMYVFLKIYPTTAKEFNKTPQPTLFKIFNTSYNPA